VCWKTRNVVTVKLIGAFLRVSGSGILCWSYLKYPCLFRWILSVAKPNLDILLRVLNICSKSETAILIRLKYRHQVFDLNEGFPTYKMESNWWWPCTKIKQNQTYQYHILVFFFTLQQWHLFHFSVHYQDSVSSI
jgi:hypothetical protein